MYCRFVVLPDKSRAVVDDLPMNFSSCDIYERHRDYNILLIVGTAVVFENQIDRVYRRLTYVSETSGADFGAPLLDQFEDVCQIRRSNVVPAP